MQKRVIELVRARTDVPAPEVVHLELSDKWLGVQFMVLRAIDGFVPSDNPPYLLDPTGWFLQGTPEQMARFEATTIAVLAKLHRITDDGSIGFLRPDTPGDTALEQQLNYQRQYYEWAHEGRTIPILERAFEVLGATIPTNNRNVLNWGDSRPGNIIYRDFSPAGVLDWEMASVGPAEVDVAWATFFHKFFATSAKQYGLTVPDMFGRVETTTRYQRLSGNNLDDLAWYEALAGLRLGIILVRMSMRAASYGAEVLSDNPDDLIRFAPLLDELLSEL